MTGRADPQVDAYIDGLPDRQQEICTTLREAGVINQGHGNATARSIQVYRDDDIDRETITAILREIVEHNRHGGWRRLSR